jgi:outer membrane protein OmpA-like peptidoglycan-associated protein
MRRRPDEAPFRRRSASRIAIMLLVAGVSAPALGQQVFHCFFDSSRDDVSPRCTQIVEDFVMQYARAFGPLDDPGIVELPYVTVEGHADTLEAMRDGLGLSERRARAVAEELVNKGLPRWVLTIRWFGAEDLMVPTPRATGDPHNRRVRFLVR